MIGFGLLFMLSPTRSILEVFRYTIPVSLVGLLAFAIALLIHSGDTLHANFDNYVQDATGVPNATAAAEKSSGFALAPFALGATLLAVTWPGSPSPTTSARPTSPARCATPAARSCSPGRSPRSSPSWVR